MEITEIASLISNFGAPLVMCGCLMWFVNKTLREMKEALNSLEKTIIEHSKIIEQLQTELKIGRLAQSHVVGLTQKEFDAEGED